MSGYIDTREGWRELDVVTPDSIYQLAEYDPADGSVVRAWVHELPVLPLPTEPYTVIRVNRGPEVSQVLVHYVDQWYGINNPDSVEGITGFEVLAEPRIVTAKAVLDRVRTQELPMFMEQRLDKIAREFGASA